MANLVRRNSLSDAVKERRLRPIYELLDSANNKKVIQEADRLLKKQPNFSCVKVLKGLAYLRMGKREDCMALINPVFEEVPTDENTIQALSICYRELDRPDLVCVLVENACKKEKSEDLLTFCYMSHVRVMDFQKQHQTAMALYKSYPKVPYFSWAVMSLYVKAMKDPPETAERMTLPLAERMMSKFIDEGKINTEHEITLYVMILFRQNKYMKAYEVLQNVLNSGVQWTTGMFPSMMLYCLTNINETEKLLEYLEILMADNTEDFQYFRQYVDEFGETESSRVAKFLRDMCLGIKSDQIAPRAALLARLLHYNLLHFHHLDASEVYLSEAFYQHLTQFGGKPFYLKDIHSFIRFLETKKEQEELIEFAENLADSPKISNTLEKLQRKTNITYLKHFFQLDTIVSDPFKILKHIETYIKNYMEYREQLIAEKINLDPREVYPQDDNLVLASLTLMETYWIRPDVWKGFYLSNDMQRLKTDDQESSNTEFSTVASRGDGEKHAESSKETKEKDDISSTNGLIPVNPVNMSDVKFNLPEEDFPILLSMAVLEYGLEKSQCCSQLRILLGKIYTFCGAVVAGTAEFMRLDIKHAQVESLGYLYLWKTSSSGVLSDATRVLNHAEAFYSSHHKESMEHIISAYKYGSWEKILEFMDFRDKIINSVQSNLIKVEKQLLEFTKEANTHELTIKVAQREEFDVMSVVFSDPDRFRDARDFKILNRFHKTPISTQSVQLTFKDDVARLQVRGIYLSLINTFVCAMVDIKDESKFNSRIRYAGSVLEVLDTCLKIDFKEFNVDEPCVYGPWTPKMHHYQSLGILDALTNFFRVLYCAAVDPSGEQVSPVLDLLEHSILDIVSGRINEWRKVKYFLINFAKVIEEVYSVIETLGFCCVLTDVLKCFLQKSSGIGSDGKSKKRKAKEVAAEAVWTLRYNSLVNSVSKCLKSVEDQIADFKFASGSWYTWIELQSMWKSKVSDEILNNILLHCLPIVTDKLNTSYFRAFTEMKLNASSKRKYIDSLLLSSPASQ